MDKQQTATFERIFTENHRILCGIAFNLVGELDAAKDIVQDVFVKVWKRREVLSFDSAIANYLKKATTHACYNYLEQKQSRMKILSEVSWPKISEAADLSYQELEKFARLAIDRLPPKCKVIFLLSRQEQMKYREIAEYLDISEKTVENQMGIALEKIREDLRPFLTREFLLPVLALLVLWLVTKIFI